MKTYANYVLGFYGNGDVEEALLYVEKHADLCKDYGTKEDQMYSYHLLHLLYEYTREYGEAKKTLKASIEIALQLQKCNIVAENCSDLNFILYRWMIIIAP